MTCLKLIFKRIKPNFEKENTLLENGLVFVKLLSRNVFIMFNFKVITTKS